MKLVEKYSTKLSIDDQNSFWNTEKHKNNIKSLRNSPKKVNIGPIFGKLGLISA